MVMTKLFRTGAPAVKVVVNWKRVKEYSFNLLWGFAEI